MKKFLLLWSKMWNKKQYNLWNSLLYISLYTSPSQKERYFCSNIPKGLRLPLSQSTFIIPAPSMHHSIPIHGSPSFPHGRWNTSSNLVKAGIIICSLTMHYEIDRRTFMNIYGRQDRCGIRKFGAMFPQIQGRNKRSRASQGRETEKMKERWRDLIARLVTWVTWVTALSARDKSALMPGFRSPMPHDRQHPWLPYRPPPSYLYTSQPGFLRAFWCFAPLLRAASFTRCVDSILIRVICVVDVPRT